MTITEFMLKYMPKTKIEKDPFSLIGEPDGKGNIIFVRHYLDDYEWKRKSKPLIIPAAKFWGTAKAVREGTYVPQKVTNSRIKQLALMPKKRKKKANLSCKKTHKK